ncbi:MAG: glycosyltransferase family 87 protein [Xanthobacteraceae bacterium]
MAKPFLDSASSAADGSRQTLTLLAATAGVLACGMLGFYVYSLNGHPPFLQDKLGYVLGRDFLNTWFFGKAAYLPHPGRFYDHDLYMRWINEAVPKDVFNHLWSYPPSLLLVAAPFGLLPYLAALAAWTCLGMLALYVTVRGAPLRTFAILLSPASLFCLINGQISLFLGAIILSALKLLDRRPITAGFLVALCTIKPQTGLLWPVLLIASQRWRVLAAAVCGTLLLVVATASYGGLISGATISLSVCRLRQPILIIPSSPGPPPSRRRFS